MSEDAQALHWHVEEPVGGVVVHAYFFQPRAFAMLDAVRKELPVFNAPLPEPVQSAGQEFRLGRLLGEPYSVFLHGTGYLSVTRVADGPVHTADNWRELLQAQDIWSAMANAMAVSATLRQPAAALLRAEGALYFLAPSAEGMRKLLRALTATEVGQPTMTAAEVAQQCLQEQAS